MGTGEGIALRRFAVFLLAIGIGAAIVCVGSALGTVRFISTARRRRERSSTGSRGEDGWFLLRQARLASG